MTPGGRSQQPGGERKETHVRHQGPDWQPWPVVLFPLLPLRDIVVFPHMIVPLFVGREKSIRALEEVMKADKQILLATQEERGTGRPHAGGYLQSSGTVWRRCCSCSSCLTARSRCWSRAARARRSSKLHRQRGSFFQAYADIDRRQRSATTVELEALARSRGCPVRAVHQAEQEDPAGGVGVGQPDRRPQQAGRYRRFPS